MADTLLVYAGIDADVDDAKDDDELERDVAAATSELATAER